MPFSPTILIVVGIVCLFLGFMASVLVNTLREESEPLVSDVEAPPGGKKGHYVPVTRLWRENKTGALVVEMEGKAFVAPTPLDEAQRAQLEQAARDLRAWLGMGLAGSTESFTDRMQSFAAAPVIAMTPPPAAPAAAPTPAAPASAVTPGGSAAVYEVAPRPSAAAKPRPVVPAVIEPAAPIAPKNKSIVMQIEDILQDMLIGSPLEQRGIHLTEDPVRGVIVQVGLSRYEGIDSVPDAEIKAFIRKAVQEWENSQ